MSIREKIGDFFEKIGDWFKSHFDSFQKVFLVLGLIFGFGLSIGLIATGVATLPFSGGLPAWLGGALFVLLLTAAMGSAGNYMGKSIDAVIDKEKTNNEKIGTVLGCSFGFIMSLVAISLNFVGVSFIAQTAAVPLWEAVLAFIPATIGAFGSAGSYIGRAIDIFTKNKTIFDWFRSEENESKDESKEPLLEKENGKEIVKPEIDLFPDKSEEKPVTFKTSSTRIHRALSLSGIGSHSSSEDKIEIQKPLSIYKSFKAGVNEYIKNGNAHLDWFRRTFDGDRGLIRANTYLQLLAKATTRFEKNVIVFSLFASSDGQALQEKVISSMGYKSLEMARTKLRKELRKDVNTEVGLKFLNESVVGRIVYNANTKKSVANGDFNDALNALKLIKPTRCL